MNPNLLKIYCLTNRNVRYSFKVLIQRSIQLASSNFRISRLFLYFILVSLFLFVAGNAGQYLIETQNIGRKVAMLLQGGIFTGLTLIVLYIMINTHKNMISR